VSIQNEIAQCYIVLGKIQKGIELLKKYNVSGVHNALIAIALTGNDITYTNTPEFGLEDAVPFMVDAFGSIILIMSIPHIENGHGAVNTFNGVGETCIRSA
jgi:hypothetical protein